ncbi:MAG: universal stress protein [Proteobacteria bacterium]|nr:universal stress protein [Pseudomonadota bacterium]
MSQIFHPTDLGLSDIGGHAFAHALKLSLANKGLLTLFHANRPHEDAMWSDFPMVRETLEKWGLLALSEAHKRDGLRLGIDVAKVVGTEHDSVRSILGYLDHHVADLIVMSTHHKSGRARWLDKSISKSIARRYSTPTLFILSGVDGFVSVGDGSVHLHNIIIPVNFEPDPQKAVSIVIELLGVLKCEQTTITLLHVGENEDLPNLEIEKQAGWTWRKVTAQGPVVEEILDTASANSADLIVLPTTGHHGFLDAVRESTAEQVLRAAICPVLTISS